MNIIFFNLSYVICCYYKVLTVREFLKIELYIALNICKVSNIFFKLCILITDVLIIIHTFVFISIRIRQTKYKNTLFYFSFSQLLIIIIFYQLVIFR